MRSKAEVRWAYSVVSCAARVDTLLPRTLDSLASSGFDQPHLFLDGCSESDVSGRFSHLLATCRKPAIQLFGNWMLGLAELLIRNPMADRFAMFQDDMVCCRNLRSYLSAISFSQKTYWNLYCFPLNEALAGGRIGFINSNQKGLGAVALVFDRQGVVDLLTHQRIVVRPLSASRKKWKNLDGGIVTTLREMGYTELVHHPSLVQHTGDRSTVGNNPHPPSASFRGEQWDATELLK